MLAGGNGRVVEATAARALSSVRGNRRARQAGVYPLEGKVARRGHGGGGLDGARQGFKAEAF